MVYTHRYFHYMKVTFYSLYTLFLQFFTCCGCDSELIEIIVITCDLKTCTCLTVIPGPSQWVLYSQ